MTAITGFHAHVYFSQESESQAHTLCQTATKIFDLHMGKMHQRPVGPHPCWSCQLAFNKDQIGAVIPWLAINRDGLTIFIHPDTGDDLADHTNHAMWMGQMLPLDLSIFKQKDPFKETMEA